MYGFTRLLFRFPAYKMLMMMMAVGDFEKSLIEEGEKQVGVQQACYYYLSYNADGRYKN